MEVGTITVVHGPMGSGKTAYLIRYIETHGRHSPVLYINHSFDNREDSVERKAPWTSRSVLVSSDYSSQLNAVYLRVGSLAEVTDQQLTPHSMVIIDEAQFFPDLIEGVLRFSEKMGKSVVAAGLLTDFKRRPFGHLTVLMSLADHCHKLAESLCDDCLIEGRKSISLFTRKLTSNEDQIEIGKDQYRGVCRSCWLKYSN